MRKSLVRLVMVVTLFCVQIVSSQDISNFASVKVDDLSDMQIENFWRKAQKNGYSIEQVETVAKSKGMPSVEVEKLKTRIRELQLKKSTKNVSEKKFDEEDEEATTLFGLTGDDKERLQREVEKDSLFGYDFFRNPKISFTPNINVATPKNYQIGPGDVLQIDVWGASEANYSKKVSKQGNIRIQGAGLINLSGMSIEKATSKINSYLRRIYSGISASQNSYQKVHTSVSLAKIRTVQVNIIGEVKVPGTYSLNALSTVLNALYASGGPTKSGTFRNVSLIRNGKKVSDFDIYQFLMKGDEKGNVQLQDQDVLIVSPYQNLVTIEGEVKRPGIYELRAGETMQDLLKYCGGFTSTAYKNTIVVERIGEKEREVKEFPYSKIPTFLLKGGDMVTIQKVLDKYKNRVTISGAVYHPGTYELKSGMTLLDLLNKASGVRKEAFLDRALIVRSKDKIDKETIAFSIPEIYGKQKNIILQPEDEIYIYNKEELREKRYITVNGAVNNGKRIDFMGGMTVEDAIVMAGGLKEGADPKNIEVSRILQDGSFQKLSESVVISSSKNLELNSKGFYLKPYDVVSVRYIKGYSSQKNVTVEGEVKFPGVYVILKKEERLSDLIERAGGLSPYAYVEGATLIRKKIGVVEEKQKLALQELIEKDSTMMEITHDKSEFRVGIDLKEVLRRKGSVIDLILEEGDELLIPAKKQTVEVQGEVQSPSMVAYIKGKSLRYYVNSAGGFTENAKKSKSYVLYNNGKASGTSSFLGIKSYPSVEPGSTILVPRKEERRKMSAQEIIGISTGLGTLGLLISQLVK